MIHPADKKLIELTKSLVKSLTKLTKSLVKSLTKLAKSVPIFAWVIILMVGFGTYYSYKEVRLRRDYQVWNEGQVWAGEGRQVSPNPPFSKWRHTKQARDRITPDEMEPHGQPADGKFGIGGWISYPPLSDLLNNSEQTTSE